MSSDVFKFLHSRRLHNEYNSIVRQKNIAKAHGIKVDDTQAHRFSKKHATNCGRPSCVMCSNPRRTFGQKTVQELSIEQRNLRLEEYDTDDD